MPTAMTNCPSSMTFFIDQDSDFFACSEILFYSFFKQLRKNLILFPEHIYQIDFFVLMIKKFVVHQLFSAKIRNDSTQATSKVK